MPDLFACHAYPSPAVAEPLVALLDEHGIAYQAHHAPARFGAVLGATSTEQFVVVSLRPRDFGRVRQMEDRQASA